MKITMWENAKRNLRSLLLFKHSIKMSKICIISKQLELWQENNYNSPRTISVKVLTLPVAAEPTVHAIKRL